MSIAPRIIRIEKVRRSNSVANIAVHLCPVCNLEKRTELAKFEKGRAFRHRKCALGQRVGALKVRNELQELRCVKCARVLTVGAFNVDKRRGYFESRCRECECARQRDRHLLRKYGMTRAQYQELLTQQGGGCAICGATKPHQRAFSLPVDHCHVTGVVRGILCDFCNQGIGKFRDDTHLLERAVEYLRGTLKCSRAS